MAPLGTVILARSLLGGTGAIVGGARGAVFVALGNEVERLRACRLQLASEAHALVLPKLTLTELMKILLHARAFVSVESGIGHLAAALDVPGIMLHGPTSPTTAVFSEKDAYI